MRHTARTWLPNIHTRKVTVKGKTKRLKLCTRCLRSQHKTAKAA